MKIRRIAGWLLAGCILDAGLSGCSGKRDPNAAEDSSSAETTTTADETTTTEQQITEATSEITETVTKFYQAMAKQDGATMCDLVPRDFLEAMCDDFDVTKKELADYISDELEEQYEDYNKAKYEVKIIKVKEMKKSDLRDLTEDLEDSFEEYGLDAGKIKEGAYVTYKAKFYGDGDHEKEFDTENTGTGMRVFNMSDKWYSVDALNMVYVYAAALS